MDTGVNHTQLFNDSLVRNGTPDFKERMRFLHPFSDPVSRAIIIINYAIVFLACLIGNILVLLVITRNKRMHTRTNLFLVNLAVADLFVGIICIFPNMHTYLFLQWYLGKVMCKLYRFMESVNLTTSMLLMEVVAVERYMAINHPLKARLFTRYRMFFAQFAVWFVSFLYNVPILFMYDLYGIQEPESNTTSYYCYSKKHTDVGYSPVAMYDTVTFMVWYILPLIIMTAMYTHMANTLWRTTLPNHLLALNNRHANVSLTLSSQTDSNNKYSDNKSPTVNKANDSFSSASGPSRLRRKFKDFLSISNSKELPQMYNTSSTNQRTDRSVLDENEMLNASEMKSIEREPRSPLFSCSSNSFESDPFSYNQEDTKETAQMRDDHVLHLDRKWKSESNQLNCEHKVISQPSTSRSCRYRLTSHRASRRRVVRLLIVVLGSFAILVLPHHIRLLLTRFHGSPNLSNFSGPVCHLLMFLNSAVNPVLYCLLSQSFRRNLRGTMHCCGRSRRKNKLPKATMELKPLAHQRVGL